MATLHSLSSASLARTRPSRAPPQSNTRSLATSSSMARTKCVATPSQAPSHAASISATCATIGPAVGPSNISLFLTALRLLDLDLLPDWPGICPRTFIASSTSARDARAGGGQKKRIQVTEWSLFRLLALYDPDEARSKLAPFFPPLDQVQSLNLRAALLRQLEGLKKSGVLGRDAVVRKTMLDECRGERLEEVLGVLAGVVLRKMVAERMLNAQRPGRAGGIEVEALAARIAMEDRGYTGERTQLYVLCLAHRASLAKLLREKSAARAQYKDLAELLERKESELAGRKERVEEGEGKRKNTKAFDKAVKRQVWRVVRNNWSGNEQWMEVLMHGDAQERTDELLSAPLDYVWRRVQSGRLAELATRRKAGLLEQLQGRVKAQKERLARWQGFWPGMCGSAGAESLAKQADARRPRRGHDLGFGAHEKLQMGRTSALKPQGLGPLELRGEYQDLIQGLEQELADIEQGSSQAFFALPHNQSRLDLNGLAAPRPEKCMAELDDGEADLVPVETMEARDQNVAFHEPPVECLAENSKAWGTGILQTDNLAGSSSQSEGMPISRAKSPSPCASPTSLVRRASPASPSKSPRRRISPPVEERQSQPQERPVSSIQQMANDILASVDAATPSPVKKPRQMLSLAERTRRSMRRTSRQNDGYGDVDDLCLKRPPIMGEPSAQDGAADEDEDNIVARTRRSMAGFEAARQKAQRERRRAQRESKAAAKRQPQRVPATVDETDEPMHEQSALLAEELMTKGGHDYEAVFMSRPRIKTSPAGTPRKQSGE